MAIPPPSPSSTCLVTGASSGIGAEIARRLAARGHGVTLVARRKDRLDALADELISAHGVRAEVVVCDLADATARGRLVDSVARLGLDVDVLVNNAGFGAAGPFVLLDRERAVAMVRTNVEPVVDLCAAYLPAMVARQRGGILNVASVAAFQPYPRYATYAASKAFVLSLSEALTIELEATGVTVTALCPGPVRTEFVQVAGIGTQWSRLASIPAQRAAAAGVRGLERGRRLVTPGVLHTLIAVLGRYLPHGVSLRVVERMYG